jgi:hypothetical protein
MVCVWMDGPRVTRPIYTSNLIPGVQYLGFPKIQSQGRWCQELYSDFDAHMAYGEQMVHIELPFNHHCYSSIHPIKTCIPA